MWLVFYEILVLFIASTFRINFGAELPCRSDTMERFSYVWDKKFQLYEDSVLL